MSKSLTNYEQETNINFNKVGKRNTQKVLVGRPRLSVDFAIVLRMREIENLGWSRMAESYRELTGEYVSRDTMKRRYLELKAKSSEEVHPG